MLFWPKLLSIAHAIASSVRPYLPLYLSHLLGFSCSDIGLLLAVPLACRTVSLGLWTVLVIDQRPMLHGFFMALLTAVGTAALVLILWIPPHATFAWSAALVCMFLDGIFYQPLTVLIDSAIIKILGDYKMLFYDSQRQWGDVAAALMAVGIGWSLDDDHDFDTLMGTILIGAVLLFLVSLSTTVLPADPALLGIPDDEQVSTPLLKSPSDIESSPTTPTVHSAVMSPYYEHRPPATYFYKPYCLFNEQLSHISEEDASMLQRMASNANTQLSVTNKRHGSIGSALSESIGADTERGGGACCTSPFRSSSHYWANTTTASTTAHNLYDDNDHHLFAEMPSLQLALLPSPPSETPMLVLPIALTSSFNFADPEDEEPDAWPVYSLMLTVFLAGIGSAMMNALLYIYLHDGLGLPMHLIGIIGMVSVASRAASKPLVHWAVHRFPLVTVTGCAHVTLIMCAFAYTWLQPDFLLARLAAVTLQILQGAAFNSLWLIAVRQVDCVLLTAGQHQRMLLRGKMSALFNSLGPALGAALTGYLVDAYVHENIMTFSGFVFAYRGAAAVLAMCWAVSRGWAVVSEDP